ncbi:4525_t:CDS:1, partial [Funneliformis mosseae]
SALGKSIIGGSNSSLIIASSIALVFVSRNNSITDSSVISNAR